VTLGQLSMSSTLVHGCNFLAENYARLFSDGFY
jgi:hypothetical protein